MSMDLITNMEADPEGHCYLLVLVDFFSKWVEVLPLKSKAAGEIAVTIYREIIACYGKPHWIRVDVGRKWEGDFK